MSAEQFPADTTEGLAAPGDLELAVRRLRPRFPSDGGVEALDRRPSPLAKDSGNRRVRAVGNQQAAPRHGAHEVVELSLDRRQIVEDVAMIELEIVQYCSAG